MDSLKEEILRLRSLGKTYNEIVAILGCSKGTVSYHCGQNQNSKTLERQQLRRKEKPWAKKADEFRLRASRKNKSVRNRSMNFQRRNRDRIDGTFSIQELLDKLGAVRVVILLASLLTCLNEKRISLTI